MQTTGKTWSGKYEVGPISQRAHPEYSRFYYTYIHVWQRKDCTPWECAIFSFKVKNSLELCLFHKPSMKRIHTLGECDVFFDGTLCQENVIYSIACPIETLKEWSGISRPKSKAYYKIFKCTLKALFQSGGFHLFRSWRKASKFSK